LVADTGGVLYVTQSPWLAQSARDLYAAHGYENTAWITAPSAMPRR